MLGKEEHWSGHVFLEIFIHGRWVLLDDTAMVLYDDYDPKMRILPGESLRLRQGRRSVRPGPFQPLGALEEGDPRLLSRFRSIEVAGRQGKDSVATRSIPPCSSSIRRRRGLAQRLGKILYPKLTHHLTGRYHSVADYREQFIKWARAGDTVVLLLLAGEKDQHTGGISGSLAEVLVGDGSGSQPQRSGAIRRRKPKDARHCPHWQKRRRVDRV